MAVLIAALCHDVDHPGLSNKFLLSTRKPASAAGGFVPAGVAGAAAATAGRARLLSEVDTGSAATAHPLAARHGGRGLHSFTAQLSLSRFESLYQRNHHTCPKRMPTLIQKVDECKSLHGGRTVSVVEAHHASTTARLLSQPLPGAGQTGNKVRLCRLTQ
jgi:hypothetical protein